MTRFSAPGSRMALPLAIAACALLAAVTAWGSLPVGQAPQSSLVGPEPGAVVAATGVRFAWLPPHGIARQVLVTSARPFDARGWNAIHKGSEFHVHEVTQPIASL